MGNTLRGYLIFLRYTILNLLPRFLFNLQNRKKKVGRFWENTIVSHRKFYKFVYPLNEKNWRILEIIRLSGALTQQRHTNVRVCAPLRNYMHVQCMREHISKIIISVGPHNFCQRFSKERNCLWWRPNMTAFLAYT